MTLPFPPEALEQHMILLGKTGAGKSSAARDVVEYLLDRGKRVIVVTAKADWWGIKLAADGKHAGYPLVVFGGEHQDLPLNHSSGKLMAELLGTANRSAVIQMRDFMPGERTQFWIDFAANLFRVLKGKLYLVIDEVHNFAPKGKILDVKAGQMLHWSNKLAAEARGIGITLIGASQRASKVHNDFLTSCETLVAMRVTTKWDREAVSDWIEGCGDDAQGKEVLRTLAQMKRGDAWVWSPEIEFGPKQVHFPMFKTYDSFRPQNPTDSAKLKGWADVDLAEVKQKLEHVVKEAEANDPAKLRARIRELESQKGKAPAPRSSDFSPSNERAKQEVAHYRDALEEMKSYAQYLEVNLVKLHKTLSRHSEDIGHIVNRMTIEKREMPRVPRSLPSVPSSPEASVKFLASTGPAPVIVSADGISKAESRVLKAMAELFSISKIIVPREMVAGWSSYAMSGGFKNLLSSLKTKGYLDYPQPNMVKLTVSGANAVGPQSAPSTTELFSRLERICSNAERKVFQVLYEAKGETLSREEVAARSSYEMSGGFKNLLSSLKTKGLIDYPQPGSAKAADWIFEL